MQGTDRSHDCLNIFLEYVPGGSIASLLAKFGEALFICNRKSAESKAAQSSPAMLQTDSASQEAAAHISMMQKVFTEWPQDMCKLVSVTDEANKICMMCRVIQGICHQDLCSPDLARAQVSA